MPRDLESLIDIQQAGKRIQKFSMGISYAELVVNEEKLSAILYQITIYDRAFPLFIYKPIARGNPIRGSTICSVTDDDHRIILPPTTITFLTAIAVSN